MKSSVYLLPVMVILCANSAFASSEGLYLGVNGVSGQVKLENTTVGDVNYPETTANTFGGGLTAGINASENFAVEAAFDGLNQTSYDGENAPTRNYWFTYLAVKPMVDFWKFNAFIEIGAAYAAYTQDNHNMADDTDGSQVTPFFGAGFGFNFNPNVELDVSVNRIQDTTTPITFGMLTLTYHFVTRYEDSGFLAD